MRHLDSAAHAITTQTQTQPQPGPFRIELPCTIRIDEGVRRGLSLIHDAIADQTMVLSKPPPAVEILHHRAQELGVSLRVWCESEESSALTPVLKEQLQATFRAHRMRIAFR